MATHNLELTLAMVCGGNYSAIVQHWQIVDPTGAPNAFQLARDLCKSFGPDNPGSSFFGITTILGADCFISSIKARQLSPTGGQHFAEVFAPSEYAGSFSTDIDASSVAGCVVWLTDGGAGTNGRTFFPGVPADAVVQGRFTSDYKDTIADVVNPMLDGMASDAGYGDWKLVLQTGTSPSFVYQTIEHGYLSPTPGTQRRRLVPL
jgi:hypothetical protein